MREYLFSLCLIKDGRLHTCETHSKRGSRHDLDPPDTITLHPSMGLAESPSIDTISTAQGCLDGLQAPHTSSGA